MVEQRLQAPQHLERPVGVDEDPFDEVGAGEHELVVGDPLALVGQ